MKLTFRGIIAIILAIITSYLVVYFIGWHKGNGQTATSISADAGLGTQESLKIALAELKSSDEMIVTLMAGGKENNRKLKISAATIADLSAKLAKVTGGGVALPDTGGWAVYQDKYLTAFFKSAPDTGYLSYSLNARPLKVSLIEDLDNTWSGYAWDILDDVPIPIDSLEIQRNRDFEPPKSWFRKLGTFTKYAGVAVVAGTAGYMAGKVF